MVKITPGFKSILVFITFLGFTNIILSENNILLENLFIKKDLIKEITLVSSLATPVPEIAKAKAPKTANIFSENVKTVYAQPVITLSSSNVTICEKTTIATFGYTATNSPTKYSINYEDPAIADITGATLYPGSITMVIPQNLSPGTYKGLLAVSNASNTSDSVNFTVTIDPFPTVNTVENITVCKNRSISKISFSGNIDNATYKWTNSNTAIGLSTGGTGDILSFTATNNSTSVIKSQVTVTPSGNGCAGIPMSFTIQVNPEPTVTKPANLIVCNNSTVSALNFTGSSVSGTTYKWGNNSPSIGLGESGTQGTPSFTATNSTAEPVTAQITVIPEANNCEGTAQIFTITVNPTTIVTKPTDIVVCDKVTVAAINLGGSSVEGTTYKWTNNNANVGLAATGTGNIPGFTATNNTSAPINATVTVTPVANGCEGTAQTFTIRVNPTSAFTKPADITVCDKGPVAQINLAGSTVSGTTYKWTNSNIGIGMPGSGNGNIPAFTATNNTSTPLLATITVTPVANECDGTSQTFRITVNPTSTVTKPADIVICDKAAVQDVNFTGSNVAGTTYKWTNSNNSIGLASSGNGNIAGFTATNTTNAPVTGLITVTPVANGCDGPSQIFNITVNPTTNLTKPANLVVCNGGNIADINFGGSSVSNTIFRWENTNTSIGLGATGNGNIPSFSGINTSNIPITSTITVYPIANNCEGVPQIFTITVNPTAAFSKPVNIVSCNSEEIQTITFGNNTVEGTTYTWTNSNINIGLPASGSGNIPFFTAKNSTGSPITGTITVTPKANGCNGTPQTFSITVNPTSTVTKPDNVFACNEEILPLLNLSGSNVNGTNYKWYNDTPEIGLPESGTGALPSFTAINNSTEIIRAKIIVIPEANGCEGESVTFEITIYPSIKIVAPEIIIVDATCKGESNGSIRVGTVYGGNGNYLFSIDSQNFSNEKLFSNLSAGTYTLFIKDTQRCSFETQVTVGEPDEITMATPLIQNVSCFGASDGRITAGIMTGGNGGFLYSLDNQNYSAENIFTGVPSGNHTIFVKDSKGCSLQMNAIVQGPSVLNATLTNTNVSCFGGSDGSITLSNPTGGTGNFEYSVKPDIWQTANTFTGLPSANYKVKIRDKNAISCVIVLAESLNITQPSAPLTVTVNSTRTLAYGTSTASATAVPAGGSPGYTYEWRKAGQTAVLQTTNIANNLAAGNYVLTVLDQKGCKIENSFTIIDKVRARIIATSECLSVHDMIRTSSFRIDMDSIAGGIGSKQNFKYEWNFGNGANPQTSVGIGSFQVTYSSSGDKDVKLWITDGANVKTEYIFPHYVGGCFEGCGETQNFQINTSNFFIGDINGVALTGEACEQTAQKFLWIEILKNANGYSLSAELNYSVSDGTTTVGRKAIGCFSQLISGTPGGNGANTPLYAPIPMGLFRLFPVQSTGNDADKLIWKCGETFNVEQINIRWTNQESRGCNEGTKPMCYGPNNEVAVITPVIATAVPTHILCKGDLTGTITITAVGGSRPYNYSINGDSNYKTSNEFFNLAAGNYSNIWVKDSWGKKFRIPTVTITEPASKITTSISPHELQCYGEAKDVTVTATGGTPPYSYLWNDPNGQSTATAQGLLAGNYTITVIDANGCQAIQAISIAQPTQLTVANAGPDQNFNCGFRTALLAANVPSSGVGKWSIVSGNGGVIQDVNSSTSSFTGSSGAHVLRWTIANANGTCPNYDEVTVTFTEDCSTLDFDGIDDHVFFGDNYHLNSGPFAIEAWVKMNSINGTKTVLAKRNFQNIAAGGYDLTVNSGSPTFRWGNSSISTSSKLDTDRWYHLSVIFKDGQIKLYVDGIALATGAATNPVTINSPFLVGGIYRDNQPDKPQNLFHGWIEEVRIWNTAPTEEQLRFLMNQRIVIGSAPLRGEVLPINVPGNLQFSNLLGYYRMIGETISNGKTKDDAINKVDGELRNINTTQENTAPLPYVSAENGVWRSKSTWLRPTVWDVPNGIGINGTPITWNIARVSHNITSGGRNIDMLGVLSESGKITMANPNEPLDEKNSGFGLTISHYLKLDGVIDLVGESQLVQSDVSSGTNIQTVTSVLAESSTGYITRDQQGTANSYNYNYWSSPVSLQGAANNSTYTVGKVMLDGTNRNTPGNLSFHDWHEFADGPYSNPRKVSNYWLHKFRGTVNVYSEWKYIGSTGTLNAGEGYTMKGTSGQAQITDKQNYVFKGKPNNGTIKLNIGVHQNYLLGNPYPSSIDITDFILDNLKDVAGGRNTQNVFNGAVYFWDHFAGGNTHILKEYIGGYATRNLLDGVPAISNDERVYANDQKGSKIPGRYIPVAQGFFINTTYDQNVPGTPVVSGGDVLFKNSQRTFIRENVATSQFMQQEEASQKSPVDTRAKIRLDFKSPKKYNRQILVGVDSNTTTGFDLGYDAALNDNNSEDMYWLINQREFIIQGVPDFNKERVLPLGIKIAKEGEFSIKINNLENVADDVNIYLKDKETNSYFNLRKSEYKLSIAPGNHHDRFEIVFQIKTDSEETPPPGEEEEEEEAIVDVPGGGAETPGEALEKINPEIFFLTNSKELVVKNPDLQVINQITLHSMSGQIIENYENLAIQKEIRLPVRNYSSSVYMVKMVTETGIIHKKLILNN